MDNNVHCRSVCNYKKLKTTQVSTNAKLCTVGPLVLELTVVELLRSYGYLSLFTFIPFCAVCSVCFLNRCHVLFS